MAGNYSKWLEINRKYLQMAGNGWKWLKIAGNGQKQLEIARNNSKTVQNYLKWLELAEVGWK